MLKIIFFLFLLMQALSHVSYAVENYLTNVNPNEQGTTYVFRPGAVIRLPDGRQTVIEKYLANGDLQTSLGIVISPEGIIRGESEEQSVVLMQPAPESAANAEESANTAGSTTAEGSTAAEGAINAEESANAEDSTAAEGAASVNKPDQNAVAVMPETSAAEPGKQLSPEEIIVSTLPTTAQPGTAPGAVGVPVKGKKQAAPVAEAGKAQPANPEQQLTLAQMLPLTQTKPDKKTPGAQKEPEKNSQQEKKAQAEKKAQQEKKAQAEKKVQQEKKAQAEKKAQSEKKAQAEKKQAAKPKAGEELHIPPEAVKTGNLDFLEGCWQGTRPEYYSKRTIRECFCFGKAGKNGKRRVFDPIGHRMCIGATAASLSKNGVLSVTSQGAACDDGERWGSAEMVCKNSGPKTPCSWVFRDANNGRQSYTIPFIRVESCGR